MVRLTDIHPLTGFLRDHKKHLERLATTGRPEVLTVNGTARVVVQDAVSYQTMLEAFDALESERIVQQRLASMERGEPGVEAADVLRDVRSRLGKGKD